MIKTIAVSITTVVVTALIIGLWTMGPLGLRDIVMRDLNIMVDCYKETQICKARGFEGTGIQFIFRFHE